MARTGIVVHVEGRIVHGPPPNPHPPSLPIEAPLVIHRRWHGREVPRIAGPLFPQELTPQAIAGHKRGVAARALRHLKAWGLLADVVPLPPSPTLEEHRARQESAAESTWRTARGRWARDWRAARARLRTLPRARARELLDEWNARDDGRRGPEELLGFLSFREPSAELEEHRRQARLAHAVLHVKLARRNFTWYVAHEGCPEGEIGVAEIPGYGLLRMLRCIACEKTWRSQAEVGAAEAAGELRVVDCRLAVQIDLL